MQALPIESRYPLESPLTVALPVGFGATVAMWGLGYLGRLPILHLPPPVLLLAFLACLFGAGLLLGRYTSSRFSVGALAGGVSGLLNLMILGSFLSGDRPDTVVPSAVWWVPGSILVSALICGAGARLGAGHSGPVRLNNWSAIFVRVAIAATLLLLGVGGLVTSAEAGLAVADWPRSFGYNMFLYPFSRMTGGIYYEHAHRLFGALVGLTTLVMAIFLQRTEPRRWVRGLAWLAVAMVIGQGVMGGLRVTQLNLLLAMVHGVFGQLFFATLVALGAFTSTAWRAETASEERPSAKTDQVLGVVLVGVAVSQLVLGAAQRHFSVVLWFHVVTGLALVVPLALHVGFRAWGLNNRRPLLQRLGLGLIGAVFVQLLLGIAAFAARGPRIAGAEPHWMDLAFSTAHQWFGAVLLGGIVLLVCFNFRLLKSPKQPHGAC